MKLISWNVNGIRAQVKKDFLTQFREMDADIFCIQETKAQDDQVAEALSSIEDYTLVTNSAVKKGYSGVAILIKDGLLTYDKDIGVEEHDQEGRVVYVETEAFYLVNVYVPNSGNGLKRLDYRSTWDKAFASFLTKLEKRKPVIVTGDFNVAHQPIDLARPKPNYNKTSGYTQVEIDGLDGILKVGLKDAYRALNPEKVQYTFWSMRFGARARNVGWRIDYFLTSKKIWDRVTKSEILDQVMGSDHCPISLELE